MNLPRIRVHIFTTVLVAASALVPAVSYAANDITLSVLTATSTPAYTNTGFATTTRAKVGDTVQYQLTLSGTPLITPVINILGMGSTTMSGSTNKWYYATTTTSDWTEGPVPFYVTFGSSTGGSGLGTTTDSQADITSGSNVTFDKTGPTLNTVVWNDVDTSTQFSGGDTLVLTWNETVATTTLTTVNLETALALTNSHTFSTTTAPTWNAAGTQLTITLGAATDITGADTIKPAATVYDAIGNADATLAAITLPDTTGPNAPTGLSGTVFHGSVTVTLVSVGSTKIKYTTDGTTPTCTTGTTYSTSFVVSNPLTIKAIGCDEANNASTLVTAVYSPASGNGGGSSSSGSSAPATPAVPATPATPTSTSTPAVPATPATPATPAAPAAKASGLSASQIQSILDVLASFNADAATIANVKASLQGVTTGSVTSAAVHAFKMDLMAGTNLGEEVKALQQFLNSHGYPIATTGAGSSGNETTVFGPATKAALVKYQKANGITPASGYFGPKTRALMNAKD